MAENYFARFADAPETFDALIDGVEFFEDMRRLTVKRSGTPRHCVGGFIEHSTITASGISSDLIHAWPDRVGELIDLEAAARHEEALKEMENFSLAELAERIDAGRQDTKGIENA